MSHEKRSHDATCGPCVSAFQKSGHFHFLRDDRDSVICMSDTFQNPLAWPTWTHFVQRAWYELVMARYTPLISWKQRSRGNIRVFVTHMLKISLGLATKRLSVELKSSFSYMVKHEKNISPSKTNSRMNNLCSSDRPRGRWAVYFCQSVVLLHEFNMLLVGG